MVYGSVGMKKCKPAIPAEDATVHFTPDDGDTKCGEYARYTSNIRSVVTCEVCLKRTALLDDNDETEC